MFQLWIKNNNVLAIVFRDNLHQPQYVEKLDRLVRFCIKTKALGLEDLDRIWASQDGKHEMIVKNIHDMLVKLAWDFSPDQLEYLFGCFQVCVAVIVLWWVGGRCDCSVVSGREMWVLCYGGWELCGEMM